MSTIYKACSIVLLPDHLGASLQKKKSFKKTTPPPLTLIKILFEKKEAEKLNWFITAI